MWDPIELNDLHVAITQSESVMEPEALRLWYLIRVTPVKWQLHPWGDLGGGFWVVGVLGHHVIWYNDIEEGFNVSGYSAVGVIEDYWCNQDELHHTISGLQRYLRTGEVAGGFGPPMPVPGRSGDA